MSEISDEKLEPKTILTKLKGGIDRFVNRQIGWTFFNLDPDFVNESGVPLLGVSLLDVSKPVLLEVHKEEGKTHQGKIISPPSEYIELRGSVCNPDIADGNLSWRCRLDLADQKRPKVEAEIYGPNQNHEKGNYGPISVMGDGSRLAIGPRTKKYAETERPATPSDLMIFERLFDQKSSYPTPPYPTPKLNGRFVV